MTTVENKQILDYGKSMYGGWYATYFDTTDGTWKGVGGKLLQDVCNQLHISKTALVRDVARRDN